MNGNFEVDKSAYPYAAAHRGNKVVIRNTQTLEEPTTVNVGTQVGTAVALRLNAMYWSRKVVKLQDALDTIETVIRDTAKVSTMTASSRQPSMSPSWASSNLSRCKLVPDTR